jgi:hypothetical protein
MLIIQWKLYIVINSSMSKTIGSFILCVEQNCIPRPEVLILLNMGVDVVRCAVLCSKQKAEILFLSLCRLFCVRMN